MPPAGGLRPCSTDDDHDCYYSLLLLYLLVLVLLLLFIVLLLLLLLLVVVGGSSSGSSSSSAMRGLWPCSTAASSPTPRPGSERSSRAGRRPGKMIIRALLRHFRILCNRYQKCLSSPLITIC